MNLFSTPGAMRLAARYWRWLVGPGVLLLCLAAVACHGGDGGDADAYLTPALSPAPAPASSRPAVDASEPRQERVATRWDACPDQQCVAQRWGATATATEVISLIHLRADRAAGWPIAGELPAVTVEAPALAQCRLPRDLRAARADGSSGSLC